ncbi:FtsK/SpoIIIE domain-containing protein [Salinibacterium soli]|uniref:FtsK/SpoIIIE domain-containing protein n=1 Tax=Antiquaquibacter soli TaxID=3064523 RepID=A0ABT9BLR8_9MICO|nr:FtsK/SpoIIIE domain-containing protein [Protaetiibacter sp. WY-16]MDO7881544.1 FtsK/SpoIIIE domain-containing protein [Protaetiibacter sp. WY-16]
MPADRLALPVPPSPPPPWRFPVVAVIAPVVVSVAIWALTGSVFALVFAALGPVTAVATLVDQRWSGRRSRSRELDRFRRDGERLAREISSAHAQERAALEEAAPHGALLVAAPSTDRGRWRYADGPLGVSVGVGRVPSALELDPVPREGDESVLSRLRELVESAAAFEGPVIVDALLGIGVCGPRRSVMSAVRGLIVQCARALPPQEWWVRVSRPGEESSWLDALPHSLRSGTATGFTVEFGRRGSPVPVVVIAAAATEAQLPPSCRVVLAVSSGSPGRLVAHPHRSHRREVVPAFLSRLDAAEWARAAAFDARAAGLAPVESALPDAVALSGLLGPPEPTAFPSLRCVIGVGAEGPVAVDLVADGPHAVVGGTTGSGKSELLVSWVIAMAAAHSPERVSVLLVDFKGGSAFAPLAGLPHTVGIITDLDAAQAERALASLRAELRYREREIALAGGRSIEDTALPRLVIVVDEFAAMLAEHPDLHALFGDIAARGRSLGVHLVLCTQRPASAVRDGVLANADLRISLRVNNAADSTAVVGSPAASELAPEARGRAIITAGGEPRTVQVAIAAVEDARAVVDRWAGSPPPRRPWCDPLPARVLASELGPVAGIPLGLLDLPEEQRRAAAAFDPRTDGHLLILGAPRSGRSTALSAVAEAVVPSEPAGAWDAVCQLVADMDAGRLSGPVVLAIDDIDALVPRFSGEHRLAWVDLLSRVLREGAAHGITVVVAAQRLVGELASVAALVPSRLLLRHSSKQDWLLAGGETSTAVLEGPPGRGRFRGERIQVVHSEPAPVLGSVEWDRLDPGRPIAVATGRAAAVAASLAAGGFHVIGVDGLPAHGGPLAGTAVVGDLDEWQSRWGALGALRSSSEILLEGCAPADVRALTRSRALPPPLPAEPGACWRLRPDGSVGRAILPRRGRA